MLIISVSIFFFFMSTANKSVIRCHRCHRKNIVFALEEIFHRQIAHTYFYFTNQSIYKNCDTPITTPSTTAVGASLGCHKMVSQFCDTSKKISVDWLYEPMSLSQLCHRGVSDFNALKYISAQTNQRN